MKQRFFSPLSSWGFYRQDHQWKYCEVKLSKQNSPVIARTGSSSSLNSVKQFYNKSPLSYLFPFYPRVSLSPEEVLISTLELPFTNIKAAKMGWQEYLPSSLCSSKLQHTPLRFELEGDRQFIQVASWKESSSQDLCHIPVAYSTSLSALSKLFKEQKVLFLHMPESTLYATLVCEGKTTIFTYSPQYASFSSQCKALTSQLQPMHSGLAIFSLNEGLTKKVAPYLQSAHITWSKATLCDPSIDACSLRSFALPVGAALTKLYAEFTTQNFKAPAQKSPQTAWQSTRAKGSLYAVSLVLSLGLMLLGFTLHHKNKTIALNSLKKLYSLSTQEPLPAIESKLQFDSLLRKTAKSSRNKKLPFQVFPNLPPLSQLINWLATYPTAELKLNHLHYQLVEKPSSRFPNQPYVVKVTMELSTASLQAAQTLKQDLLDSSGLINPNKPLSWRASDDKIHLSFYLANRNELL